jgi:hypothetical protein
MSETTVDLLDDPIASDLGAQLEAKAPRRYWTRTTAVLAGLLLVAVGFLAGAQVQKRWGTTAAAPATAGRGTFGGGNFGGGNLGGGARPQRSAGPGAGVTTGTVKLVDGSTVYVETADGNVITVKTTGSTSVELARAGALTDLAPGAKVSVEGQAGGQDVVNATKVTRAG